MAGSHAHDGTAYIAGDGSYPIDVASESGDQDQLEWVARGRGEEPVERTCTALLRRDPAGIGVFVQGVRVGALPAAAAEALITAMRVWGFDQAECRAVIDGGWYRTAADKGDFRVRLDANPEFIPVAVPAEGPELAAPAPGMLSPQPTIASDLMGMGLAATATLAVLGLFGIVWLLLPPAEPVTSVRAVAPAAPPSAASRPVPQQEARLAARTQIEPAALRTDAAAPIRDHDTGTASAERLPEPAIAATLRSPVRTVSELRPRPLSIPAAETGGDPLQSLSPPAAVRAAQAAQPPVQPVAGRPSAATVIAPSIADELKAPAVTAAPAFALALAPVPPPARDAQPVRAPPPGASDTAARVPDSAAAARGRTPPAAKPAQAARHAAPPRVKSASRTARARAKSRRAARHHARRLRPAQRYAAPPPEAAPAAAPTPLQPPIVIPNPIATRMVEDLQREWAQQAVPRLLQPLRPAQ
jgi:hypothetical protein